jgi:signal recognition particle receptor subunit beta
MKADLERPRQSSSRYCNPLVGQLSVIQSKTPILFLANKKDLPHSLSPAEISKIMNLSSIIDRDWNILYFTLSATPMH